MTSNNQTETKSVRTSKSVWKKLKEIAKKQGRTANNLAAKVLTDYVEREWKEPTP